MDLEIYTTAHATYFQPEHLDTWTGMPPNDDEVSAALVEDLKITSHSRTLAS